MQIAALSFFRLARPGKWSALQVARVLERIGA